MSVAELVEAARETSAKRRSMTLKDFFALPTDDTLDRELIRGELWEQPVTVRNRFHALTELRIGQVLQNYLDATSEVDARALSGEAGVLLPHHDTAVGVDVVVFTREVMDAQTDSLTVVAGIPLLAVEIVSPSDTQERQDAKVKLLLEAGTPLVWLANPSHRSITAFRPEGSIETTVGDVTVPVYDVLPGFNVATANLFAE